MAPVDVVELVLVAILVNILSSIQGLKLPLNASTTFKSKTVFDKVELCLLLA
jgi:hypothetical protein